METMELPKGLPLADRRPQRKDLLAVDLAGFALAWLTLMDADDDAAFASATTLVSARCYRVQVYCTIPAPDGPNDALGPPPGDDSKEGKGLDCK